MPSDISRGLNPVHIQFGSFSPAPNATPPAAVNTDDPTVLAGSPPIISETVGPGLAAVSTSQVGSSAGDVSKEVDLDPAFTCMIEDMAARVWKCS